MCQGASKLRRKVRAYCPGLYSKGGGVRRSERDRGGSAWVSFWGLHVFTMKASEGAEKSWCLGRHRRLRGQRKGRRRSRVRNTRRSDPPPARTAKKSIDRTISRAISQCEFWGRKIAVVRRHIRRIRLEACRSNVPVRGRTDRHGRPLRQTVPSSYVSACWVRWRALVRTIRRRAPKVVWPMTSSFRVEADSTLGYDLVRHCFGTDVRGEERLAAFLRDPWCLCFRDFLATCKECGITPTQERFDTFHEGGLWPWSVRTAVPCGALRRGRGRHLGR